VKDLFYKNMQDRLAELETLRDFLKEAITALDATTTSIITGPGERLKKLLGAPDKKAMLLEMAGVSTVCSHVSWISGCCWEVVAEQKTLMSRCHCSTPPTHPAPAATQQATMSWMRPSFSCWRPTLRGPRQQSRIRLRSSWQKFSLRPSATRSLRSREVPLQFHGIVPFPCIFFI
jgi:hypothetical protein